MASTKVEVHVQKVRFKSYGRQGLATFDWDRATGCYCKAMDCEVENRGR